MIIRNSAICNKCKKEIESRYRHDFRSCRCGAFSVDGGMSYLRRVGLDYTDTSIVANDKYIKLPSDVQLSAWLDGSESFADKTLLKPIRENEAPLSEGYRLLFEPLRKEAIFWPANWPDLE